MNKCSEYLFCRYDPHVARGKVKSESVAESLRLYRVRCIVRASISSDRSHSNFGGSNKHIHM